MDITSLEQYLHRQIPLSAAMQVSVRSATTESVVLAAPLQPNINHKSTAFLKMLARKKLARIEVQSDLIYEDAVVGRLSGRFVAFLNEAS